MSNLKSHIVFVCILAITGIEPRCQDNSLYVNSYISPFIANAACTGSEYYPVVNFSTKKQWLDLPGAPATSLAAGNIRLGQRDFYNSKGLINKGSLKLAGRIGLGAMIYHDENGPLTTSGVLVSYAYHIPRRDSKTLSFGLSAHMANHNCDNSILKPDQSNDTYLLSGNDNISKLNFGFGIYYYSRDYFAGIAVNNLLPLTSNTAESLDLGPSIFALGGYRFNRNNKLINWEPSCEIKKLPGENIVLGLHSKFYVKRLNWFAVSMSTSLHMNVQFAFRIHKMSYIRYNYGYSVGRFAKQNSGIHELSVGINLGLRGIENIRETI